MKPIFALLAFALLSSAQAVEYSQVDFRGAKYTVCRVDVRKERLELFLRDEKGQPLRRLDRLAEWVKPSGRKLVFAMNAGMYLRDFSAQGLFVNGGHELVPLDTKNGWGNFYLKPNGVFLVTKDGAQVVETSEYPKLAERTLLATQSGPLLVRRGVIHPAFQRDSTSKLFRNGVGLPSPEVALFVITETPVNFFEFATLFRDHLQCPDALFLDGTISSLCAPALHRLDFKMDLGPMIGVTE